MQDSSEWNITNQPGTRDGLPTELHPQMDNGGKISLGSDSSKDCRSLRTSVHNEKRKKAMHEMILGTDPIHFSKEVGKFIYKSGIVGCDKESDGQVVALYCYMNRIDPISFAQKFYVIKGRLSLRADWIVAEFRRQGGKIQWLQTGENGVAEATFHFKGDSITQSFTMQQAQRAGLVKEDSAWNKWPENMLRWRLCTQSIPLLCDVCQGGYDETVHDDQAKPPEIEIECKVTESAEPVQTVHCEPVDESKDAAHAAENGKKTTKAIVPESNHMHVGSDQDPATPEQIKEIKKLLKSLGYSRDMIGELLNKFGAKRYPELSIESADIIVSELTNKSTEMHLETSLAEG